MHTEWSHGTTASEQIARAGGRAGTRRGRRAGRSTRAVEWRVACESEAIGAKRGREAKATDVQNSKANRGSVTDLGVGVDDAENR